jgi:hypothetical protein
MQTHPYNFSPTIKERNLLHPILMAGLTTLNGKVGKWGKGIK